jgi:hypothetical protein
MTDGAQLTLDAIGAYHAPWRGAPDTERAAAVDVFPFSGRQRARYVLELVDAGARGLTDHEAHAAGVGSSYHVAGTRRHELVDDDGVELVVDSGRRRNSPHGRPCAVWVARPELAELVARHRAAIEEKAE